MSAIGTEAPSTQGGKHWTHRYPERVVRGSKHYAAKLTETQVGTIRLLASIGYPKTLIARTVGINYRHCLDIIARRKWRHVGGVRP